VDDDWFDAFVFVGDVRQVLQAYTGLTGRPNVPPDWSFYSSRATPSAPKCSRSIEGWTRTQAVTRARELHLVE
jgi:alpha-D-xyloside xylohydrolase